MIERDQIAAAPEFQTCAVPGGDDEVALACYHTALDPRKPAIVIALPFGIPAEVARPAFNRLGRAYNVVTWESRYVLNLDVAFSGAEDVTAAAQVADLLSVMRALAIEQCRLIGYCSGGGIALLAASQHPERFSDLILVSGEYQLFRRGHVSTAYQRSIDAFLPVVATGRKETHMIFATMAEVAGGGKGEQPSELQRQMNLPFSSEEYLFRYARNYMAYRDFDALALAAAIPHATLVVAGRRDEHTNVENAQAIAEHIPRSTIFIDEQGDHYAFCQDGSATLDAIGRHLDV